MTVDLGRMYLASWQGKPPGISPEDYSIWRKWRPLNFTKYIGFYFNVRLIGPAAIREGLEPQYARMWMMNTAKRIDVLGIRNDRYDIIELRSRAGLSAIGHLLGYFTLWIFGGLADKPTYMLLITDAVDPEVALVAQASGIQVIGV